MELVYNIFQTLLIVVALSTDSFVSGFAYGARKIKIPFVSVIIINVICSVIFMLSLLMGQIINPYLPASITKIICFVILSIIGLTKVFDSLVKSFIRKHRIDKKIDFSVYNIKFILSIYADPEEADIDKSKILSPYESAFLAIALSLDSIAVGIGAGITETNSFLTAVFAFVVGMLSVITGSAMGNKIAQKVSLDLTWVSGLLLIVLALIKL